MSDPSIARDQQSVQPVSKSRRRWTKCGCIVAACLLVLLVSGLVAVRYFVKAQYTPEQWDQMKRAEEEVLQLPPEWHQPATLPPAEVVAFAREVFPKVTEISQTHEDLLFGDYSREQELLGRMRAAGDLTAEEETSLSLFMDDLEPILEQSSATVQVPGYTFELDLYAPSTSSFLEMQILTKFASIASLAYLRQGNPVLAVETAALPLRMRRRPAQSNGISHLISTAVASISAYTLFTISDSTSNTRALSRGVELMEELKHVVFPGKIETWRYSNVLGPLRFAAAYGYPVNLEPQPLVDFYTQLIPFHSGHYYTWITKNFPLKDPRAEGAQARLELLQRPPIDYEEVFKIPEEGEDLFSGFEEAEEQEAVKLDMSDTTSVPKLQLAVSKLLLGVNPYAMLLSIANETYDETEARIRVAMAMYDLAQIHFAQRLAEVRGEKPANMETWLKNVPGLETQLLDPFTSSSYLYGVNVSAPYSVGPDKKDNGAAITYDATNGTFSTGDVWMDNN